MSSIRGGHSFAWPRAVLLLCLGVFAPSRAYGSCGEYVVLGGPSMAEHSPTPHSSPTDAAPSEHGPAHPVPPCHGPFCSSGQAPPPAAPPATPDQVEHWGCLAPVELLTLRPSASCPPPEPRAAPSDRADAVFHPPRSRQALAR
jgi:hypothetical protein